MAVVFYMLGIRKAEEAISDVRRELAGEPLAYDKTVFDLQEAGQKKQGENFTEDALSAPAGFNSCAWFEDKLYVASCGGLLILEPTSDNKTSTRDKTPNPVDHHRPNSSRMDTAGYSTSIDYTTTGFLTIKQGLNENRITSLNVLGSSLYISHPVAGLSVIHENKIEQIHFKTEDFNRIAVSVVSPQGVYFITENSDIILTDGKEFLLKKDNTLHLKEDVPTTVAFLDGKLFIGTNKSGLFQVDDEKVIPINPDLFSQNRINSLKAENGNLLAATDRGTILRDISGNFRNLCDETPVKAAVFNEKSIISGTYFSGLITTNERFRNSEDTLRGLNEPVAFISPLPGLMQSGDLLLGTDSSLLIKKQGGGISKINISPPRGILTANYVTSIERDSQGRYWIGYFDRGIDILSADYRRLFHLENDDIRVIRHIRQNFADGAMYCATSRGVAIITADFKYRMLTTEQGLINNEVSHIFFSDSGPVYSTAGGVSFDRGGLLRSVYAFHGLGSNHTYSTIYQNGYFYTATLNGLSRIKDLNVTANSTTANSPLPHNWVTALAVDNENNLWIGTYGGGIIAEKENGTLLKMEPSDRVDVNNNAILSLEIHVLIGTLSNGILVYSTRDDEWRKITRGLPSRNVTAFMDEGANILVGTDSGLIILNKEILN
ncbi:MAG: hypothetical protein JW737_09130 [Acidobacteria bacterium]|nr:hypothetical protein [Acidobacteriota bacterium]